MPSSITPPPSCPCDPASLAHAVRDLAPLAHRLLRDPSAPAGSFRDLARRIARLQERAGDASSNDLAQWLESLRRKVEARERTLGAAETTRRHHRRSALSEAGA